VRRLSKKNRTFVLEGDGYVSLPAHILDTLASLVSAVGADVFYQSALRIVESTGDSEPVILSAALEQQNITPQEFFDSMVDVMPYYFPILKSQLTAFNAEIGISEKHVGKYVSKSVLNDYACEPLLMSAAGSRNYTLLQVAACQAGISPDMHRYWYVMLAMLTHSMFESEIEKLEEAWIH
jgi:hypothetical protein